MARQIPFSILSVMVLLATTLAGIATILTLDAKPAVSKAPQTAASIHASKKIAIIGDSLTSQAGTGTMSIETLLQKEGYRSSNWYIYGVDGKRIASADKYETTTVENIAAAREKLGRIDVWLIALVTNDRQHTPEQIEADVQTVMKTIGDDRVVWLNATSRDQSYTSTARANSTLQEALSGYKNATYLDFDSYIHKTGHHNDWWKPKTFEDPIHMTEEGYAVRNRYYVDQLNLTLRD
jgi:hypothetical protein